MSMPSEYEVACQKIEELKQRVESLTRVLEGSQLGFWDWNIVTNEVKRNTTWAEMLGYKFDEIAFTTQQWTDFVHPDDRDSAWASINAVLEGHAAEHALIYRMKTKRGDYKWILDRARVVERDSDGKPLRMSGTHTDVHQLKTTEDALRESEKRFRGIFENAGIGIAEVLPDGTFLRVNDTYCRMTGYSQDELLNVKKTFQAITFPDDIEPDLRLLDELINGFGNSYDVEKRYIRKDGTIAWVHRSVSLLKNEDGQPISLISAVQDITNLKKLQEELEFQARIDYLTGIPNRRYFMELAEHEIARIQRYPSTLAVIMLDVDFFKDVNDKHGHKAGDTVLQKLAHLMKSELREVDVLGRMGGEEFAILLPETDTQRAIEVADRLKKTVADRDISLDSDSILHVTISIGLAVLTKQQDSIEILLNKADKGLYQAKNKGRNRIEIYE